MVISRKYSSHNYLNLNNIDMCINSLILDPKHFKSKSMIICLYLFTNAMSRHYVWNFHTFKGMIGRAYSN